MYDRIALRKLLTNSDNRTVDDVGKVFPPSHDVYKAVAAAMPLSDKGVQMNPKHVHTIVNNNRGGMYDRILQEFGIKTNHALNVSSDTSFNASGPGKLPGETQAKRFRLVIPLKDWKKIRPQRTKSGTRKYYVLKPRRWTSTFATKIYQQTGITCAFAFKRAKVYVSADAECYSKFEGDCHECGSHLEGKLLKKPGKNMDVIYECELTGIRPEVVHTQTRQLNGYLRAQIAGKLVDEGKCAAAWRIEEANRLMEFGDDIPPILFSNDVVRKAKQQELERRLNTSGTDPVDNLNLMKYITLEETIHVVSKSPFFCIYWTKEQEAMYAAALKFDPDAAFVIDATGGIGKKIKLPDGQESQHLFLYQCMCVSEMGKFPAFQFLSAAQDAATITYFLFYVARNNPSPRTVISDFGRAILIAVSRAFCGMDLSYYLQSCHDIVVSKTSKALPECFIRLDVSHLIAMVARWPSLKGKLTKVRQFYLRSIGRIYQMDKFADVESLLKSVLVVALSKDIGSSEDGTILASEDHVRNVGAEIKGTANHDEKSGNEDSEKLFDDEGDDNQSQGWQDWATSLYDKAEEIASRCICPNAGTPNAYHNPEVAKKLKNLIGYLPLWTGIMRSHFTFGKTIASSAHVEAEFSKLKRLFKGQLPTRADRFIVRHIEYINGTLRLAGGESLAKIQPESVCNGDTVNDDTKDSRVAGGNSAENSRLTDDTDVSEAQTFDSNSGSDCNVITRTSVCHFYDVDGTTGDKDEDIQKDNMEESFTDKGDNVGKIVVHDSNGDFEILPEEGTNCGTRNVAENPDTPEVANAGENQKPEEIHPLNEFEGWMGRGEPPNKEQKLAENPAAKRTKPNYLEPCADWDMIPDQKTIGIPLIRNGNARKPVKLPPKRSVIVRQTCAYDSLLQIFANALTRFPVYKAHVSDCRNSLLDLAQSIIADGKLNVSHYKKRAQNLLAVPILEHRVLTRSRVETLNAKCNAGHLYEYLFANSPSYTVTTNCTKCLHTVEKTYPHLNVDVNVLLREGFAQMQSAISVRGLRNTAACSKCKAPVTTSKTYGPQITIDMSVVTDPSYLGSLDFDVQRCNLASIAKNVSIDERTYTLSGIAEYHRHREHYVALTHVGLNWYEYDDTKESRENIKSEERFVQPHMIIYVQTSV